MVAMAFLIQIKEQILTRPAAVRMDQLTGLQAVHPTLTHGDCLSMRMHASAEFALA